MILEVAVDIYSHKVDSVHKMGSEVANTLGACTEDCNVSAARKKDHRVITNNCDETANNTDNIIRSRSSEDLRTGGGHQQSVCSMRVSYICSVYCILYIHSLVSSVMNILLYHLSVFF